MFEFLVFALFQAVAGEPTVQPSEPAPAAAEQRTEPERAQTHASPRPAQERRMRRERVCEEVQITGRRMPQRVCRTVLVPDESEPPAT